MLSGQKFLFTTIGKKYMMALTGIVWSLFVFIHMAGNMLIFLGARHYNLYSHALTSNPLIYVLEIFLVLFLTIHAVTGISLKISNMKSKPKYYDVQPKSNKNAPLSSRFMVHTGSLMLIFIILHIFTFKFGTYYHVQYDGVDMRDIYRLVIEKFNSKTYVVGYSLSMLIVGIHMFHGVKSIFQSLGLSHPRYDKFIRAFGYSYALIVAAGFLSQPIYVYFFSGGLSHGI